MLATLIASVVSGEATETVRRLRGKILVYVVAGLMVLCGVGFFIGAGYVATARELGTITAALLFGGGFVLLAIIILVAHRVTSRVRAKRVARRRQTEVKAVASATALALLPTLLAGRGRSLALIAPALAILGYAIWRENAPRDGDGDDD